MRVLVIDDHVMVRKGILALLEQEFAQIELHECESAEEAFPEVLTHDWDLVIADLTLGGRSGLDLLRDIRSAVPKIPVLIVSAHAEKDYAIRALKLGASGYLSKQSAADALITAVKRILSGGHYVSPALAEELARSLNQTHLNQAHDALSNRELEVLKWIAKGNTLKEIAAILDLSDKTISTYRARISDKLGINSNVELTRFALKAGLVD